MNTSDIDNQNELLKSIATSLKGIHSSLEQLTGAVEGVAESIEKAHEPEGDLGVHLVNALKEVSSSLQRRAQQDRSFQPQQQHPKQHPRNRRGEHQQHNNPSRGEAVPPQDERDSLVQPDEPEQGSGISSLDPEASGGREASTESNPPEDGRKHPRGGSRRGKRQPAG